MNLDRIFVDRLEHIFIMGAPIKETDMRIGFPRWVCSCCFFLGLFLVDSKTHTSFHEEVIKRSDFPDGFLFGVATSAYQVFSTLFLLFQFSDN